MESAELINLNLKRKIFDDFNTFKHNKLPTTNPIEQRDILINVLNNTSELSGIERNILLKIISETVCKGFYYTFISQEQICKDLGCGRKSLYRGLKKLTEDNWIAIKQSEKNLRRNIIDFNVDKAMTLGSKGKNALDKKQGSKRPITKSNMGQNDPTEENYTNSSKEEFTVPQKFAAVRKLKRNITSLFQTWKEACAKLPAEEQRKITIGAKDLYKFRRFFHKKEKNGYVDIVDKWHGTTEELHQFIVWCVLHWRYLKYRMEWAKHMPSFPDIGWFISNVDKFHDIWLDNISVDNSDENVILMKQKKHAKEMRQKWKNHEF